MLITCPECRREVSDRAAKCIHCGNPLGSSNIRPTAKNNYGQPIYTNEEQIFGYPKVQPTKTDRAFLIATGISAIIVGLFAFLASAGSDDLSNINIFFGVLFGIGSIVAGILALVNNNKLGRGLMVVVGLPSFIALISLVAWMIFWGIDLGFSVGGIILHVFLAAPCVILLIGVVEIN